MAGQAGKLSVKHELFVQALAQGRNAVAVYAEIYKNDNQKSCEANSSRLLARPDVQERLAELRKENQEIALMTRDELLKEIQGILQQETAENRDRIQAGKLFAQLTGYMAPKKSEHKHDVNVTGQITHDLSERLQIAHQMNQRRRELEEAKANAPFVIDTTAKQLTDNSNNDAKD